MRGRTILKGDSEVIRNVVIGGGRVLGREMRVCGQGEPKRGLKMLGHISGGEIR